MIVGDLFPDDVSDMLKWIQFDLYGTLQPHLLAPACECYLSAARLLGVETDLTEPLRRLEM